MSKERTEQITRVATTAIRQANTALSSPEASSAYQTNELRELQEIKKLLASLLQLKALRLLQRQESDPFVD